jgi:hypothetical protein
MPPVLHLQSTDDDAVEDYSGPERFALCLHSRQFLLGSAQEELVLVSPEGGVAAGVFECRPHRWHW